MVSSAVLAGCGSDDDTTTFAPAQTQLVEFVMLPNFAANTVSVRGINTETGRTAHLSTQPTGTNPRAVRTHPSRNLFFVANQNSNNISGFLLTENGGMNNTPGSPYAGPTGATNILIHPSGAFAYVAGDSQIRGYTVAADGSLVPIAGSTLALPQNAEFDGGFSNQGAFLHLPLNNSIQTFSVNPNTGVLTATTNNAVAAGTLRDLSIHPGGTLLLATVRVAGANNDQVLPFSVNGAGVLTAQATNNLGFDVGFGDVARNGQFYTGNDNLAQIHGFNVNAATGALTALGGSPFATPGGGVFPGLDPTNSLLFSVSNAGNTLAGSRRLADGTLQAADGTPANDNLSNPVAFDFFQFVR
jgi:6-phosphogluconolactonase (cycloisomerase 2 family)